MKKIYLYVAFALASIGMISCTDILDQDPLDSFTDEAVWNDLALSETYLNAQYMNLMAENMKVRGEKRCVSKFGRSENI